MKLPRYRLRTLFVATAFVALLLFVASHLSIYGAWEPSCQESPAFQFNLTLRWDDREIVDLFRGYDPDGKLRFWINWFSPSWEPPC